MGNARAKTSALCACFGRWGTGFLPADSLHILDPGPDIAYCTGFAFCTALALKMLLVLGRNIDGAVQCVNAVAVLVVDVDSHMGIHRAGCKIFDVGTPFVEYIITLCLKAFTPLPDDLHLTCQSRTGKETYDHHNDDRNGPFHGFTSLFF